MKIICLFLLCLPSFSSGNTNNPATGGEAMMPGYYVTIGVYAKSKELYAVRYMEKVKGMGFQADYGFSQSKNHFYVYLFYSENYKEALNEMRNARKDPNFSEAWVYVLMTAPKIELSREEKKRANEKSEAMKKEVVNNLDSLYEKKFKDMEKTTQDSVALTDVDAEEREEEVMKESKDTLTEESEDMKIVFNVLNARNNEPIEGEVQVIDVERSKLLDVIENGKAVALPDPDNGSGELTLIVDNFGFRKNQINFNYYKPDTSVDFIRKEDDTYQVYFEMIRYHKGDIATLYNVYFFKDASIMKPESKFELNSLLQMMKENPNYKIRIHGHTNGNNAGKIISLGDGQDYFSLSESNEEGFGSAKRLSKERAEIIRDYLVDNGIAKNRMEIKAWGGKRMIYEKLGTQAKNNVRVEIEILEE